MKTSAVQAFRNIVSKIHPQVGLTERESQRLLNALTSSFKDQLDEKHPDVSTSRKPLPSAITQLPQPPTSSTERHLASVLTNPLLASVPTRRSSAISQLQTGQVHPVKVFEECVSSGSATVEIAILCLEAFLKSLATKTAQEYQHQIKEMAAGARTLRWMWSTDLEKILHRADRARLFDYLVLFLVKENRDEAVWELLTTETNSPSTESLKAISQAQKWRNDLLLSLMRAHCRSHKSKEKGQVNALLAFLNALDIKASAPANSPLHHLNLAPAGTYLVNRSEHFSRMDSGRWAFCGLYDRFIKSVPQWSTAPGGSALHKQAILYLRHPYAPSASSALSFIQLLKASPDHPLLHPSTQQQKWKVLSFFFDTVQLLQKQGFADDAAWVIEFMRQHFKHDLVEDAETRPETIRHFGEDAESSRVGEDLVSLAFAGKLPGMG
ncbi:hypothetical protein M8818_007900 [Zalaria obscura]|uniref:Uncharacterized protein n=1 Tax=Zalaria obscura TaxID=2024903 RepID=A0ACC3S6P7_9PEZI